MAGDGTRELPRRALIAAAAASAAALAAQAASAAAPGIVAAGDGDPVKLGQNNGGTASTWVSATNGSPAFGGRATGGDGVTGWSAAQTKSGVYGVNDDANGYGVFGRNSNRKTTGHLGGPAVGVEGNGAGGQGQLGTGNAGAYGLRAGTANEGWLGTPLAGVEGRSKTTDSVRGATSAPQKSGVLGLADDPTGYGVWGHNTKTKATGHLGGPLVGVEGRSPAGDVTGQLGTADAGARGFHDKTKNEGLVGASGAGVVGVSGATGTRGELGAYGAGVKASGTLDHPALQVNGGAQFMRAGSLTVPKGKTVAKSAGWPPSGVVEAALAVLIQYRPGVAVAATVVDGANGTVTVYLTKAPSADTRVAFFLFGGPPLI